LSLEKRTYGTVPPIESGEAIPVFSRFFGFDAFCARVLRLAFLSPEIIHQAIIGAIPEHISLATLKVGLPVDWEEQKMFLRIE